MGVRPHLLEWQWSDYSAKHQDRTNLRLHIATGSGLAVGLALIGMVVAVVIQGRGHRRERETPTPFAGPIDFVSRRPRRCRARGLIGSRLRPRRARGR